MMAGRYTLIDQTGLAEFLPLAREKNMGVMLAGVFNSGILATGSGKGAKFDYTDAPKKVVDKVKAIEEICKKHKITLREAAIQFALGHPAVVTVVLGAVKPEEVKANVQDATVAIPASLWSDLKSAKLLEEAAPTKG
jgi:D-threo-aldose 1-dehydrogenase